MYDEITKSVSTRGSRLLSFVYRDLIDPTPCVGMPHETTMFGVDPGTNPPSRLSGSRPGSSHSAPGPHDTSIDHHYEFDTRNVQYYLLVKYPV